MSETKCYLCAKPGKLHKLFRKCKHESACHDCLRDRYIIRPQHENSTSDGSCNPFLCFHPECNLVVRNTQIKRLVRSQNELQRYYDFKYDAKLHKLEAENQKELKQARFGPDWVDLVQALGTEILLEACRCPRCKMMITKNGGCDHMTCICGCEFNWSFCRRNVTRSCHELEQKYIEKYAKLENIYAKIKSDDAPSPSKKKARRVKLAPVDDDFMEDFEEDYSSVSEEDCTESVNPEISDVDSFPSNFDISSFPSISLKDAAVREPTERDGWEQDFHILELASDALDDSWSQFDDDSQLCNSQTTWEEVSEVSSVASFHSKTAMSFLEAARTSTSSNQAPDSRNRWKEVSKPPRPMIRLQTIAEHRKSVMNKHALDERDHLGEMFDADFMYEGAKCSRGGKKKIMFKRQSKAN